METMIYTAFCFLFLIFSTGIFLKHFPRLKIVYGTLGRDLHAIYLYLKALRYLKRCHAQHLTVIHHFRNVVQNHKDRVCFIFEGQEWTYQKVDQFSNKVAHCFLSQGYRKGDEVALFMENCPEYVCIWLGLAKIGIVTAFINTNQREDSLAHSINVIDLKAIIFGGSIAEAVQNARVLFRKKDSIQYFCYSERSTISDETSFPVQSLNDLLMNASDDALDPEKFPINFHDKLLYIYTSGTTGLPKAAVFRHSRFLFFTAAAQYLCQLNDFEIFYNTLPMYHTSGGVFFVSVVLNFGGTMVLRKKFSASNFWKDAVKYKATVSQHIGEMCRFLLNTPEVPEEKKHNIRLAFGNGLGPDIWQPFQDRFKIRHIVELYGATEGNATLINMFGKAGFAGFVPNIFTSFCNVHLIKVDKETGKPLRDNKGLCIRCKPGEPGEMVAKIVQDNPIRAFDGYVDPSETQKKIITDCLEKGDSVFLSGDLLVMTDDGYVQFLDRLGDTFKWHGENVSAHEVEIIISKILGYVPCTVYGVEIPNVAGRAGMAAIQIEKNLDMADFYKNITKRLPCYAVPLFIRICSDIEATGTYKLRKVTLQREGYNPEEIRENLYFLDHAKRTYVSLTKDLYSDIINGKVRL